MCPHANCKHVVYAMRVIAYLALAVFLGCTTEPNARLFVEHQAKRLDQATESDWVVDSEVVTAEPGSFPQPLTLRYTTLDEGGNAVGIGRNSIDSYGEAQVVRIDTIDKCVYRLPDVPPSYCIAEFDVLGFGSSMLLITAVSPTNDAPQVSDCIYYAVVDPSADVDVVRMQLEQERAVCQADH